MKTCTRCGQPIIGKGYLVTKRGAHHVNCGRNVADMPADAATEIITLRAEVNRLGGALRAIRDVACGESQCKQEARIALARELEKQTPKPTPK